MYCRSLFVLLYFFLLAIVMSVLLRFTDSDYPFWYLLTLLLTITQLITYAYYNSLCILMLICSLQLCCFVTLWEWRSFIHKTKPLTKCISIYHVQFVYLHQKDEDMHWSSINALQISQMSGSSVAVITGKAGTKKNILITNS